MPRHPVDDEVAVRRHVVDAGLAVELRANGAGQPLAEEGRDEVRLGRVGLERARLLGDEPPGHAAGRLDRHLAVNGKAVEHRLPVPHPDRKPARGEVADVGGGEVAHLFLAEGEPPAEAQVTQQGGQPGRHAQHDMIGVNGAAVGGEGDSARPVRDPPYRGARAELCPAAAGQRPVGRVPPADIEDPGVRLVEAHHVIADPPAGPPAPYLGGRQVLSRNAERRQRPPVVVQLALPRRAGHGQIQAAGPDRQLEPGLGFDVRPRVIGGLGQRGVRAPVIGVPDDAGVIL